MFMTGIENIFHTLQIAIQAEATYIAAEVFPETEFELLFHKLGREYAALFLPNTLFELLSPKIGNQNLSITFKSQHSVENFRVMFFPKIKTLILSGYSQKGMAHLIYMPGHSYQWFNGMRYTINSPDDIGEKFEFLANKFYPFLLENFLG